MLGPTRQDRYCRMAIRRAGGLVWADLTESIIRAFYQVYNQLGPGLLESVYTAALEKELKLRGHKVSREIRIRMFYKGEEIARQRIDMLVDERVIVEVKAFDSLAPSARPQLDSYLRGSWLEVGLLLHFGPRPKFYRHYSPNERKDRVASAVTASPD